MANTIQKLKNYRFVKSLIYFFVGIVSFPGIAIVNKLNISGTEYISKLPKKHVLFVSNHQTYFADVITFLHIFCAVKWRKQNRLGVPYYLLNPFTRVNYVAAVETMRSSWLSRFFTWAGAITVRRLWNEHSTEKQKGLNPGDTRNISKALEHNWVITFPQGTTTPYAPGRKGTAYIIKRERPVVVPVVIDGFSKAFGKKGLKLKKWGTKLTVRFKEPLQFTFEESLEEILEVVMDAIEQSKKFKAHRDHLA